ncbi:MAG: fused MFS/spermidine synthase [Bryobacteraceae bacterium]|jgi:spermidine synthase
MQAEPRRDAGLAAILALMGFSATIGQIVLLRELIVVFSGNEISLGAMLACWLFWTAAGSAVAGRFVARRADPRRAMAALLALLAAMFPAAIYAVRASRVVFQPVPGELLGPGAMLVTAAATLSGFCLCSGCAFAAASRLYARERAASTAQASGAVYLLEAAGAALGGLLASLVLIRFLGAFDIAILAGLANLGAALRLAAPPRRRLVGAAILATLALPAFAWLGPRLEQSSLALLWRGFRLVGVRNSVYGNLAVIANEGSRSIYENGLVLQTVPDPAAAEEAVHYALLQHPAPRRLLLIGGGINGSLAQALQHATLERVDYVEADPAVIGLARAYFSEAWAPVAADARIRVHTVDGRLFLKQTRESFDVIIVNLPDPQTAQLNRFYTLEFFREAARRLSPGGVLSFQLRASENYISPELAALLRSVNKTLRQVFPEVGTMPGQTVHFFAAMRAGVLTHGPGELLERLRARRLATEYVREYFIPFRMMPDRVADLEAQIRPEARTPVNRDFAPVAYYFGTTLWSAQFSHAYRQWFDLAAGMGFGRLLLWFAAVPAVLALALGRSRRGCAALAAGATGFTMLGLEILLLLAFQAIYGYVYHQLAMLTAAFMAGLALGSWRAARARCSWPGLGGLQVAVAAAPLLLLAALQPLAQASWGAMPLVASNLLFPVLALGSGALGGAQFIAATRLFFAESKAGPGALYGADLFGACLGALLLSAYVVPVFGFWRTALLMAAANAAPAAAIFARFARR